MILILSGPGDSHAGRVQAELQRRGVKVAGFDPDQFSALSGVGLALAGAGVLEGSIDPQGHPVQLEHIHAVYCGHPTLATCSHLDELWEIMDVGVVPGMPSVVERAFDVERQRHFARVVGFRLMDDHLAGLISPTRLRVVVVGYRVFGAALPPAVSAPLSRSLWDACIDEDGISPAVLPVALAERCRDLVEHMGLEFATLDVALDADGNAVFCGLNPFGHFGCIEDGTGMPVTRAVVDLLLTEVANRRVVSSRNSVVAHPSRRIPFLRVARGRQ